MQTVPSDDSCVVALLARITPPVAWLTVLVVGTMLTILFRYAATGQHSFRRAAPGGFMLALMWQLLQLATHYRDPVLRAEVDTIVLGCTHYPLLTGMISLVVGKVEFFKDRVGIDALLFGFGRAERDFVNDCVREQLSGRVLHHKVGVTAGEFLSIECDGCMLGLFKSADDPCQC